MFYCRKMWTYMFCVHNMGYNKLIFYNCHEGQTNCGPDKVFSFIYHCINSLPLNIDELHVVVKNVTNILLWLLFMIVIIGLFIFSPICSPMYVILTYHVIKILQWKNRLIMIKMYIPNECNGIISTTKHIASL